MDERFHLTAKVEVRLRTTGEILDDAWRLYLAHAPRLLALSGLFLVPAATALLLLLALPAPTSPAMRFLLPALAATLLPLTGLGAGACQAAFRRLAEGQAIGLGPCLAAGLRHGLGHVTERAVVLTAALPGLVALGAAGLPTVKESALQVLLFLGAVAGVCWTALVFLLYAEIAPYLAAGGGTLSGAWQVVTRTVHFHFGKAALVTVSRFVLQAFVMLNLHLLVMLGLWIAGNLAGLNTALAGVLLSLGNPVYVAALLLVGWLLLAPFSQAASYLLYADLRARHEGLDLWYRVQRHFSAGERSRAGIAVLALLTGLLLASPTHGADERLATVQQVRKEIQQIAAEVRAREPYPGGIVWTPQLRRLADCLNHEGGARPDRYGWFGRAIVDFESRSREGALQVLADLDRRLALIEESLTLPREQPPAANPARLSKEEIKKLLPRPAAGADPDDPAAEPPPPPQEEKQPVVQDDAESGRSRARGPALVGPSTGCGCNVLGWMVLAGLLAAVVVVGTILALRWRWQAPRKKPVSTGESAPSLESLVTEPHQSVSALWRRAEELARGGHFLEAVRILYLAVLAVLHRANLIRYERTQTNGEYLEQLRRSAGTETLHPPFRRLVRLFEEKWYGKRSCEPDDYRDSRQLAEEIREGVSG